MVISRNKPRITDLGRKCDCCGDDGDGGDGDGDLDGIGGGCGGCGCGLGQEMFG